MALVIVWGRLPEIPLLSVDSVLPNEDKNDLLATVVRLTPRGGGELPKSAVALSGFEVGLVDPNKLGVGGGFGTEIGFPNIIGVCASVGTEKGFLDSS